MQCATFSKSVNPRLIDESVSDFRIPFPFASSFWISVSGCKLTILPDIQPENRIVLISARHHSFSRIVDFVLAFCACLTDCADQCCHCCFFSLDLGVFCFICFFFIENVGFFNSGQIFKMYAVLLYFSFKNAIIS